MPAPDALKRAAPVGGHRAPGRLLQPLGREVHPGGVVAELGHPAAPQVDLGESGRHPGGLLLGRAGGGPAQLGLEVELGGGRAALAGGAGLPEEGLPLVGEQPAERLEVHPAILAESRRDPPAGRSSRRTLAHRTGQGWRWRNVGSSRSACARSGRRPGSPRRSWPPGAGLSSHAVSALERGTRTRPYPHTVRALADALGASDEERAALVAAVPARARPARAAGDAAPTRRPLPRPSTSLLGREDDVARVAELVGAHRLVTLTGTGGVGKTRLALAVAEAVADRFTDGVAFVELAPLRGVEEVLPAVADAVDAPSAPGMDAAAAVVERLRGQRCLVVLDNVEHLLGIAPDVADLLEAVPGLTVVATSRAPLRVRGEVEAAVEPLGLPDADGPADSPAVRLLLERAGAVSPGWGTAAHDGPAVAALCVRLAGIPLALELAAARARLLDPASLLDRLDVALLAGARDLPERQRTMRATLDWSYGLLTAEEQALLRLLSAFVGGFRLDDVERVVELAGGIGDNDVLCVLEALIEQSLVVSDPAAPSGPRQRLLEPVTQFARDRLHEAGEREAVVAAHAAPLPGPRRGGQPALQGRRPGRGPGPDRPRAPQPHGGLRAQPRRRRRGTTAGRLAWSLWMYWWLRGHVAHGRRLVRGRAGARPPRRRARAGRARRRHDDLRPRRRRRRPRLVVGGAGARRRRPGRAGQRGRRSRAGRARGRRPRGRGRAVRAGAADRRERRRRGRVDPRAVAGLARHRRTCSAATSTRAVAHVERGLASARARGDRLTSYIALYNLSQVELARGRLAEARRHLEEGMRLSLETGDQANLAYLLDATAVLEAAEGTHARVPLLLGAAQAIREAVGSRGYGYYRPDPAAGAAAADEARRHLGADRYDDALDTGRGLAPEEAAGLVLGRVPTGRAAGPA